MLYITAFIMFLAVFMAVYWMLAYLYKDKIIIENRIRQIDRMHTIDQEEMENKTLVERVFIPFYQGIGKFLIKMTPGPKIFELNKKLERAGILKNSTTENWLYIKTMIVLIVSILAGFLVYTVKPDLLQASALSFTIMLLINVCFNFYLSRQIEVRKKRILRDLSYTVDLITVSVEAGLSFDGAMARVVSNISGDLCDEFAKSLKEIRMGIERKSALKNMSERCGVRELSMLLTAIIQADELGVSLGKVLRIESSNLRENRKQKARETAMKAPIKMLFPLIFFIFPSIFIIILGPALIKIMDVFKR